MRSENSFIFLLLHVTPDFLDFPSPVYLLAFKTDLIVCQSLTGVEWSNLKQHFNLASSVKFFAFRISPDPVLGISDVGSRGMC